MSSRKKRRDKEGPMPAAGAGLIRFFQDETEGIKIGPVAILIMTGALIGFVLVAHFILPGGMFPLGFT